MPPAGAPLRKLSIGLIDLVTKGPTRAFSSRICAYAERVRGDLGPLWEWLPAGALDHDPNVYLKSEDVRSRTSCSTS